MKNRILIACLVLSLAGCISIATHEEQMRRCRSVGEHADELEAKVKQLESQLQENLKGDISQGGVAVKSSEGNVTITMVDKVLFSSGEWELHERGQRVLGQVVKTLKDANDRLIRVEGHTDGIPVIAPLSSRFPSNWDLAAARASAVVRYLEKSGVDGSRLEVCAFGDKRPVGDNNTAEGRSANRRVEISLVPLPAPAAGNK